MPSKIRMTSQPLFGRTMEQEFLDPDGINLENIPGKFDEPSIGLL
jgi:hypothetical protein